MKICVFCLLFLVDLMTLGSSSAIRGRIKPALTILTIQIILFYFLCWSKLFSTVNGFKLALIIIFASTLITAIINLVINIRLKFKMFHWRSYALFLIFTIASFSLTFFCRQTLLGIDIHKVNSLSMYPTLQPGDYFISDTRAYLMDSPQTGDIIIFSSANKNRGTFVKRVGKPENGNLISPNQLFVYGDNIDASLDSRYLGPISLNQVKGKAVLILYRNDTHRVWLKNLN